MNNYKRRLRNLLKHEFTKNNQVKKKLLRFCILFDETEQ